MKNSNRKESPPLLMFAWGFVLLCLMVWGELTVYANRRAPSKAAGTVCPCGCGKVGCACTVSGGKACRHRIVGIFTSDKIKQQTVYVFSYDGCGPCAAFFKDIENETPEADELNVRYKFKQVKLDPKGSDWPKHAVTLCPTFRLEGGGDVIGYITDDDKETGLALLKKALEKERKKQKK